MVVCHGSKSSPAFLWADHVPWMKPRVLLALAVLNAAPAFADFTDKVSTTPVVIQDGFGTDGNVFPDNGLEYCCPTAVTMSLSYLGVNGFNQIGPSAPTSADELNLDRILSGFMQTDAINGTASNALITSAIGTYLAAKGISTSNYTLNSYASPTISQLAGINANQTVVDLVCGYYNISNTRTGGHCVALVNQGINVQGQSSSSALAIDNPLPGAFAPLADSSSNSLEYLNTVPTTSGVTGIGSLQLDSTQYPSFWGSTRLVVETAIALTVNATQQSVNNPTISSWNLFSIQSLNPNGGDLTVLAPLTGAGAISITQPGTIELQSTDSTTGNNVVTGASLKSDITTGTPFGTGNMQLQTGILQLSPVAGTSEISLTIASAASSKLSFNGTSSILLNRDSHSSLTLTIGGFTDNTTPNLTRTARGTIIIAADDGTAALGSLDIVTIAGTGFNLPTVKNGIVSAYIVAQDNDANASGDFLNYSSNHFVAASYVFSDTTAITSANSTTVYGINSDIAVPASTTASVYALRLGPNTLSGGTSSTLDVGSTSSAQAGVILNGGTIATTSLNFGFAEGLIYTSFANGTISSTIQGSSGLTLFGPGGRGEYLHRRHQH